MVKVEKEFLGNLESIPLALDFIASFAKKLHFPESFTNKIVIVTDELLSNIIRHGYQGNGGPIWVCLSFAKDNNEFCLTLIDEASEFNQLSVSDENAGKGLQVGGLGIFMVKKIMSETSYERKDGKNVLTLRKRF